MAHDKIDVWLRMYEEQIRHVRHQENLRSQSTNMIIAISAAIMAFMTTEAAGSFRGGVAGLLALINAYGLVMSLKHYERSKLHSAVAAGYRKKVSGLAEFEGESIESSRELSHATHEGRFKLVRRVRVYVLWAGLHGIIAVLGAYLAFNG